MDSLLANYASSDEEEQERSEKVDHPAQFASKISGNSSNYSHKPKSSPSLVSSLPPPKSSSSSSSSSLFSFLPPPKSHLPNPSQALTNHSSSKPIKQLQEEEEEDEKQQQSRPKSSSSSIFSSLPQPKSQSADPFALNNLSSAPNPKPKKVVQLKFPINPSLLKSRDDEDDKEREGKKSKESLPQTASVKSFLSSIPAPKNSSTLGALPSAAGSGRRSIVEAEVPSLNSNDFKTENEVGVYPNVENYGVQWVDGSSSAPLGDVSGSAEYAVAGIGDGSGWVSSSANYESYDGYTGCGNYDYSGQQYDVNSGGGSTTMMPSDIVATAEVTVKLPGKRGRNDIPQEIVEVKQDELIKNRPREDQARLTGIAFGPSYQPVSTKGKPSKLHKRKHQIGSLYFDMKNKEMELSERRAKGFLTKAETQAKYGW
ncbi:uncharacterized protein LOC130774437 [Actinidia eriantha]|uniref:uncharacterized protein LOC130774437 n=1 Tax=Actinidia eriantha TaxID=165200 RepID=UPI00258CF4F6|nr:uncharacterized protein LOC130774437 [Actinidia eriantha]